VAGREELAAVARFRDEQIGALGMGADEFFGYPEIE